MEEKTINDLEVLADDTQGYYDSTCSGEQVDAAATWVKDKATTVTTNITALQADVGKLQTDVTDLQSDIGSLNSGKISKPTPTPVSGNMAGWGANSTLVDTSMRSSDIVLRAKTSNTPLNIMVFDNNGNADDSGYSAHGFDSRLDSLETRATNMESDIGERMEKPADLNSVDGNIVVFDSNGNGVNSAQNLDSLLEELDDLQSSVNAKVASVALQSGANNGEVSIVVNGGAPQTASVTGLTETAFTAPSAFATAAQGAAADEANNWIDDEGASALADIVNLQNAGSPNTIRVIDGSVQNTPNKIYQYCQGLVTQAGTYAQQSMLFAYKHGDYSGMVIYSQSSGSPLFIGVADGVFVAGDLGYSDTDITSVIDDLPKVDDLALAATAYQKPTNGIPLTDLEEIVRNRLATITPLAISSSTQVATAYQQMTSALTSPTNNNGAFLLFGQSNSGAQARYVFLAFLASSTATSFGCIGVAGNSYRFGSVSGVNNYNNLFSTLDSLSLIGQEAVASQSGHGEAIDDVGASVTISPEKNWRKIDLIIVDNRDGTSNQSILNGVNVKFNSRTGTDSYTIVLDYAASIVWCAISIKAFYGRCLAEAVFYGANGDSTTVYDLGGAVVTDSFLDIGGVEITPNFDGGQQSLDWDYSFVVTY